MRETILELPPLPGGAVRLIGWATRPGRALRRGDPLCLVEQDGRALDIPALREGVVHRLLARPGALAPGAPLALLAEAPAAGEQDIALAGGGLHLRRWLPARARRGTCLLLHGFGGSLDGWAGTAAALAADGFAVVAPDLPAHGASTLAAGSAQEIADRLIEAWPALGMDGPVHLVGHSMGGATALVLAAARPHPAPPTLASSTLASPTLASLTLIAPLGLSPTVNGGFITGLLAARTAGELADALRPLTARPVPMPPEALAATLTALRRHATALAALAASLADGDRQRLDLSDMLAALRLPARLILGDADTVLPSAALALPPHIPLHRLGCGHMPHWEQPGLMRRLLSQHDWQPATGEQG